MSQDAFQDLRNDLRAPDALRPVVLELGVAPAAAGSVLIRMGHTQVICACSVEEKVPTWMRMQNVAGGWLTGEYRMLPYANPERGARPDTRASGLDGRSQEIQRLVGRSLRAAVDLEALGKRTLWLDCDVLQADGGTRTASITGAYVAMRLALRSLLESGALVRDPVREPLAAVSVGVVHGRPLLDLCYEEDRDASVDMNVVMTASGRFIEVQGTAESEPYRREELDRLLNLAEKGIRELLSIQRTALTQPSST